jgi:hypothetical protein
VIAAILILFSIALAWSAFASSWASCEKVCNAKRRDCLHRLSEQIVKNHDYTQGSAWEKPCDDEYDKCVKKCWQ